MPEIIDTQTALYMDRARIEAVLLEYLAGCRVLDEGEEYRMEWCWRLEPSSEQEEEGDRITGIRFARLREES